MKLPLFLLLLLLETVAALHLRNDAPYLDSQESQADLSQDLEGSGEQEGESVLTEEGIQSEGEQEEASNCQDAFEDKKAMESDPGALDENFQCPREEDTVEISGSPGCKTCRYKLNTCRRCYNGNLVSIHNRSVNNQLQCLSGQVNDFWVWIGGIVKDPCSTIHWVDGSSANFRHWAHQRGSGHCLGLSTRGGHWRRECCERRLPFICSF
uniref:Proteoglycan 2, pro eosinophil major basic protein n=1 Tax=Pipistrellus kuhlii TaxID=59472 RepID=A0A7J7X1N5_PIPKU|nr:proteoglycan 2, pro eosinophil major basic protein [Pipistrellus kuhlii]